MTKIQVPLEVEQATYDLAKGVGQFAVDVVKALGDGFQPVKDTVALGAAAIADLLPVASNFAQLAPELKEDGAAFISAWLKAGLEIYAKLVAK